jgi:hypothetical protein
VWKENGIQNKLEGLAIDRKNDILYILVLRKEAGWTQDMGYTKRNERIESKTSTARATWPHDKSNSGGSMGKGWKAHVMWKRYSWNLVLDKYFFLFVSWSLGMSRNIWHMDFKCIKSRNTIWTSIIITTMKDKQLLLSSKSCVCFHVHVRVYVCGAGDWTQGLTHVSRRLCHWAISPLLHLNLSWEPKIGNFCSRGLKPGLTPVRKISICSLCIRTGNSTRVYINHSWLTWAEIWFPRKMLVPEDLPE